MSPLMTRGSLRVRGSGLAVPVCATPDGPRPVITNADVVAAMAPAARNERSLMAMARMLDEGGLRERYWSRWVGSGLRGPDAVDLAEEAARKALADAGCTIADVDMVVLALSTSTLPTIATATPLAARLGYQGPSLDLKAGCAGSLYALHLASALVGAGYRRLLLVGADTMASYVDARALMGFPNVGDGAAALVVEAGDRPNFSSAVDGAYETWDAAGVFGPLPPVFDDPGAYVFRGQATALREVIAGRYRQSLDHLLEATGQRFADLSAWIPHQIAPALLKEVHGSYGAPETRLVLNADRYGNAGSASLYLALHESRQEFGGRRVGLTALGGGMRWGSAVWEDWS